MIVFTRTSFLGLFAVVYGLWWLCRRDHRAALAVLLTGSLVCYGYRQWAYLPVLVAYALVDWAVARWMLRSRRPALALTAGVAFNLGVLAYWKYTPLLLDTLADLGVASRSSLDDASWALPVGISFFAFTGIAYMADVYRGSARAEPNPLRFTLYLSFFPHLVAGPILRAGEFLSHLQPRTMPTAPDAPLEALLLLSRGYFKKMVLADRSGPAIDPFFQHVAGPATGEVWALPYLYLYAFQIYFDFSGYTDIARGLALLFGFRWPENFRAPYLATSVRDFWQRWHITLSAFLRDYLYIPLGGSRGGEWRTARNLMATMLLGGLWHGGQWSFLVWGGLHGALLVLHRLWSRTDLAARLCSLPRRAAAVWHLCCIVVTFHLVSLAWCFFRVTEWRAALSCVGKCFVFDPGKLLVGNAADLSLWLLLGAYAAMAIVGQRSGLPLRELAASLDAKPLARGFAWGFGAGLALLAVLLSPSAERPPFIYFQF